MVLIKYPRIDLNDHADLIAWRNQKNKKEGDWTTLKNFLAIQPGLAEEQLLPNKCWYSELPQGDDYALDVEHFRPKSQASALSQKHVAIIKDKWDVDVFQDQTDGNYPWLEYDYRNYRLTTAKPNRGGAKHIYFPIALNGLRLNTGEYPWTNNEYNLLLDPTNEHDSGLLIVLPNGRIIPKAPKTTLTANEFKNLAENWKKDGINYLRAAITIELYRLNDKVFITGREKAYKNSQDKIQMLVECIRTNASELIREDYYKQLFIICAPSAPFCLGARCGLDAFDSSELDANTQEKLITILKTIKRRLAEFDTADSSWTNE